MRPPKRHGKKMRSPVTRAGAASRSGPLSLRANGMAILVAAAIFSGTGAAQAAPLRLGSPQVLSSLGNPLWVKIPIGVDGAEPGADIDAARFSLGAPPLNAPVPFVDRAEITLESVGNKYSLIIRSRNAIDEPAIGIVLRESLPNGIRSREFFLLLDPAPLSVAVSPVEPSETVGSGTPVVAPQTLPGNVSPARAGAAVSATAPASPRAPRTKVRQPRQVGARSADNAPERGTTVAAPIGQMSILPIAKGRAAQQGRSLPDTPRAQDGPRLRLSFGEGLGSRPPTTEAERAQLRMRQFTLDMDDLTSGLLERQHKITQLEKQLADLSARVSAAERLIGAVPPVATGSSTAALPATPSLTPPVPAPSVTPPPAPEAITPAPAPAAAPVAPKAASPRPATPSPSQSTSPWTWLLVGAALLAALFTSIWGIRLALRRRDRDFRLTSQHAQDYVAEVLSNESATVRSTAIAKPGMMGATAVAASGAAAKPANGDLLDPLAQEIHFELPELPPLEIDGMPLTPATAETKAKVVTNIVQKPTDDATSRRMRYLQSRYQDIAILMPPIDAPQRLLRQAATVYDEGATDFAKRLLKFAAYSRPYTEEFWLALLELLYREKFASDYVVNAKWFQQYHSASPQWDEVVRIGFLLDPREPLFATAAHWSHDEPVPGVWLPSGTDDKKPLSPPPDLKLEFTK